MVKLLVFHAKIISFYGPAQLNKAPAALKLLLFIAVGKTLISPSQAKYLRISDSSKIYINFFRFSFNPACI